MAPPLRRTVRWVNPSPDVQAMADAMQAAESTMAQSSVDRWADSPYRWLLRLSSRKRGKAGEVILQNWLRNIGMTVGRSGGSGSDRAVNGHEVEIKTSTLWESDVFVWQQIRDQEYTHALLLGIEPQRVRVWCVPKDVLRTHAVPQHTGSTGTETLWLTVKADAIPEWMHPYGGELDAAAAVTRSSLP